MSKSPITGMKHQTRDVVDRDSCTKGDMKWRHIYPVNDWIDHKTEGLNCICEPLIDWENMLVVHNSADGRELVGFVKK